MPDVLGLDGLRYGLTAHAFGHPSVDVRRELGHDFARLGAVHHPGTNHIGPDIVRPVLHGDAPCEPSNAGFHGGIDAKQRQRGTTVDGRDVDDRAAFLLLHVGNRVLAAKPHAAQVNRGHTIEFLFSRLRQGPDQTDSRVVHQNIEPLVTANHILDGREDLRGFANVSSHHRGASAVSLDALLQQP